MATTATDLLKFLDYAGQKGLLNPNTAHAHKAAARAVFSIDGDLDTVDVTSANLDGLVSRFINLNSAKGAKALSSGSLETYRQRTRQAVSWFQEWTADPAGWRPAMRVGGSKPSTNGKPKKVTTGDRKPSTTPGPAAPAPIGPQGKTADFIYPLREGVVVHLWLPLDLKLAEYRRLSAHMRGLVSDAEREE